MMGYCDSAVNMLATVHLHLPKIYRVFSDEWQFDNLHFTKDLFLKTGKEKYKGCYGSKRY